MFLCMLISSYPGVFESSRNVSAGEADVLKNSRRRGIIRSLSSESAVPDPFVNLFSDRGDFEVDKEDIIEKVASWETGHDIGDVPRSDMKSVRYTLHQDHFPLLDDRDVINYFEEDGVIEALPVTYDYAELVEDRPRNDSPFPGVECSGRPTLTMDMAYLILSNDRRRHVLDYLGNSNGLTELSDVSEYLASMESDSAGPISSDERKTVYIDLDQWHLPKMNGTEVIHYDGDRKTIEQGQNFENLVSYLPDELESI